MNKTNRIKNFIISGVITLSLLLIYFYSLGVFESGHSDRWYVSQGDEAGVEYLTVKLDLSLETEWEYEPYSYKWNLFDKDRVIKNRGIDGEGHGVFKTEDYLVSEIKVEQNTYYTKNLLQIRYEWYDAGDNFISGSGDVPEDEDVLLSPENARYLRVMISSAEVEKFCFVEGCVNNLAYTTNNTIDANGFEWVGKRVVVVGDSITDSDKWQYMVADLIGCEITYVDAQQGQLLGTMSDRLTKSDLRNMDAIIIFGGTNDYGEGVSLGEVGDSMDQVSFYGSIYKNIDQIRALNDEIEIIFLTPMQRGAYDDDPVPPETNAAGYGLEDYADAIIEVCIDQDIGYIDMYTYSGITMDNLWRYTIDNLHPNEAGYQLISEVIAGYFLNGKHKKTMN